MADDPFAQYGGAQISQDSGTTAVADDPFAKYGGAAISQPVQPVSIPRVPAGATGSALPSVGTVPVPEGLRQGGDSPSLGDYAKTAWNALTQPEATGTRPGVLGNAATAIHNIGGRALNVVGQAVPQAAQALSNAGQHPVDTLMSTTPAGMASDAASFVTNRAQEFQNTAQNDLPLATENVAGDALAMYAGKKFGDAVKPAIGNAADAVSNTAGRVQQVVRPAVSPAVVPPIEQSAASLAKAVNPPGGIPEGFEDALANQTPGIKDYAARTGNPLNTRWELAKAALGHAQELNDFYDKNVLGPSADRAVPVDDSYQGTSRNGKATLGDIDTRLGKINDLLRPAYDKGNVGATMTALERSGLVDEANSLRTTLYTELAKDTGMNPDEIRQLRTGYGQSYDIASKTDAARRRVGPGGPVPLTKEGLIQSVLEHAVGGRDAIADRGVQSALQQFRPATSPIANWQSRVASTRAQAASAASANQAAAQQEFLHGTNLDQAAQAASQQRAQHADAMRSPSAPQASTRYRNGKAYVLDPKSGWWVPQ